jgi:hypothetical protein
MGISQLVMLSYARKACEATAHKIFMPQKIIIDINYVDIFSQLAAALITVVCVIM